jgi:uncharacterized DUF497 family protein
MNYEWDEDKNKSNKAKHGVTFEQAQTVFADLLAIEIKDEVNSTENEERFILLGMSKDKGVLVVAYCERNLDTVRIISAREANKSEEVEYERQL